MQKRAAKFANNMNGLGWETLTHRRMIARICALFKACTGGRAWKVIGDRLLKPRYLSREDHNRKIRTRKQRTDVGKYSFVNGTVKSWNQLPAGLLASFPSNLYSEQAAGLTTQKFWLIPRKVKNFLSSKGRFWSPSSLLPSVKY